jgi:hypothetical protein
MSAPRTVTWRSAVLVVAVASCLPYLVFKLLWLSGAMIGVTDSQGAALMNDSRHVIGNYVTVAMDLAAIGLVIALTSRWSRRLPGWLLLVPAWVATGLLAPIAIGLPVGLVVQMLSGSNGPVGSLDGLAGWVFATIYGGFAVLGCCLAVLLAVHVVQRWPDAIRTGPRRPAGVVPILCGAAMLGYACALLVWSVTGPGAGGPVGFQSVTQRTVLAVTGVLVAVGFVSPFARRSAAGSRRWATVGAWLGCSVATLSGPTFMALSHDGIIPVALLVATVVSAPTALIYSINLLRSVRAGVLV